MTLHFFQRMSLPARVCTYYAVFVLASFGLIKLSSEMLLLPANFATAFLQVTIMLGLFVGAAVVYMTPAAPEDQKLVLVAMVWCYGPFTSGFFVFWIADVGFGVLWSWMGDVLLISVGVALIVWVQISSPFARAWMRANASDKQRMEKCDARMCWPLKPDEYQEVEIHIKPIQYFGFLAGISAAVFIVVETTLGEWIADKLGSSDYVSASIVALAVAATVFPIHRKVSHRFTIGSPVENSDDGTSSITVKAEFVRAFKQFFRVAIVRFWYITLPGSAAVLAFLHWVSTHLVPLE